MSTKSLLARQHTLIVSGAVSASVWLLAVPSKLSNNVSLDTIASPGFMIRSLTEHAVTGVNFIFYYGTSFFTNSGIKNPFIISMITSVVNTLSTFPGLYATDKFGRRPTLLVGAIGMAVCQVGLRGKRRTTR